MKSLTAAATVMMSMLASQVKSFETECNYIQAGGLPMAADVCMATGISSNGYKSQKFYCSNGDIMMKTWSSSLTCSGTASNTFDIDGIANELGVDVSTITWYCDGSKTVDKCGYVNWKHSVLVDDSPSSCNSIVKYSTLAILTNVCAYSDGIAFLGGCDASTNPDEFIVEIFFNTDCSGSPFYTGSQGTICTNGTKDEYTCTNCGSGGQCEVSMTTYMPETTPEPTSSMQSCPYANIQGLPYALNKCTTVSNQDGVYGEKYMCDSNDDLIMKRWIDSGDCSSGTVDTYDSSAISSMNGGYLDWSCAGTDDCSHSFVVIYNSTYTCDEKDYYRQLYLVDNVCTSYFGFDDAYTALSCEDDTITYTLYGESICQNMLDYAIIDSQCIVENGNGTSMVQKNAEVTCLKQATTTKSGTTTTSNTHNTSPANFVRSSMWCVMVFFVLSYVSL